MQGLSYLPLTKWLTCFAGSNIFFLHFIQKKKIKFVTVVFLRKRREKEMK